MTVRLIPAFLVSALLVACSSSSTSPVDGGPEDASYDGTIGPLFCGMPVASTCAMTAPCSFSSLSCANAPVCDGYMVVTDGTWTYFYSAYGGALVGEVPNALADGGAVECPYAFVVPDCTAMPLDACDAGAGPADSGSDAASDAAADGSATVDGGLDASPDASDDGG